MTYLRIAALVFAVLIGVEILSLILHVAGAGLGLIWHHPILIALVTLAIIYNRAPWILGNSREMIKSAAQRAITTVKCEAETRKMRQLSFPIADQLKLGSQTFHRSIRQDVPQIHDKR